ncbi:hypothetical protein CR513_15759, partial [Mucuna pruriens]
MALPFGPSFKWIHEHKTNVFFVFCVFHAMFHAYFQTHGLIHETSCPHTPQQNGVSKRKNKHILETTRALLIGSHAPNKYWEDVINTTVHLINQLPVEALNFFTPLQDLTPSPFLLKFFGCTIFVHLHKHQRSKLNPCVVRCIFWRYVTHTKGYRYYDPIGKCHYSTMDATFLESESYYSLTTTSNPQGATWNEDLKWLDCITKNNDSHEVVQEARSLEPSLDENSNINIRYKLPFRHNRGKPPNRYSLEIEKACSKYLDCQLCNHSKSHAILEKIGALEKNDTWILVALPKGKK